MPAPITRRLDVTGTFCPLPILLAVREMMRLRAGDRLEIVGDDPAILEDMPVWCERTGHRLIEISERQGTIVSIVEKSGGGPGGHGAGRGGKSADGKAGGGGRAGSRRPIRRRL
ncbi:MAG: sulfurtransferase TusA family protein [Acidobacteria bacterium]|nr:sulfurtransferase TusA family protein [Acidobacteriota bacterium]